ncbi:variant erythrocyte surface antigen-1 family protein [Babesia caballi]|uniref:Variant erythrocyte surface antigen-1 family protein n=1 Tax=Babesia caballi TaxID=5871 RepID=A0AAV4M1E7_BABCB|nr:variant erythrocyte surface antigen-1 family protein [Babesia caballi]
MSAGKKSLTEAPTNLKEAIDWVIKISELENVEQLGEALEKLFRADVAVVAWEVREVFDVIKENIIEQFDGMNGFPRDHYKGYLSSVTEGLKDVERPAEVTKDNLRNSINKLVDGLKSFLGYKGPSSFNDGIISSSPSYTFTYNTATWIQNDVSRYAAIFLGILPAIFFAVTLIYWKCSEKNGWQNSELKNASNGTLKQFLTQMCFNGVKFNDGKKASQVVGDLKSGFTELSEANPKDIPYSSFLRSLLSKPPQPSNPLNYLHRISYYYITSPAYSETSITTSKASIATLGATALAGGAYGLNIGGFATSLNSFFGLS